MAERRMFTQKITESDAFLDMPLSTQALYFHFCMNADDDGFVKNPKRIQKMLGGSEDDCKLLILKRFVLPFESSIIVIKHWRMHNLLRKDRYKPSEYTEEKSMLNIKENGAYTLDKNQGTPLMSTSWQPNDTQLTPQDSIGKISIDEYNIESKKESNNINNKEEDMRACVRESYDSIFEDFGVSKQLKDKFIEFIRHCQLNGKMVTNDKLKDIIVRLDMAYDDDVPKIQSLKKAINGGYFDIAEK